METQKSFFVEYAAKTGAVLVRVYADEGISGTKIKNRIQFQQMIRDAEHGLFEEIVVKDISRFARNTVDLLQSIRHLKNMGIEIRFLTANMTSMGDSEFVLTIFGALAQEESANISKRIRFGLKVKAERGRVPNRAYGYDKHPGDSMHLAINEREAEVIRRICRLYLEEDYSMRGIAVLLNQEGVPTKSGAAWSQTTVRRLLANPLLEGKLITNKSETTDFLSGKIRKCPESEWFVFDRPELCIIPPGEFERIQVKMFERGAEARARSTRPSNKNLFSCLIKCKECGRSYRRCLEKGKYKWRCSTRNLHGLQACKNATSVSEEGLIKELENYFISALSSEEEITKRILKEFHSAAASQDETHSRLNAIKAQIVKLNARRQKYMDMYADDLLSREELNKQIGGMRAEIECLKNEENVLKRYTPEPEQLDNVIKDTFTEIREMVDLHKVSNARLKRVVQKIEVGADGSVNIYLHPLVQLGLDKCIHVCNTSIFHVL